MSADTSVPENPFLSLLPLLALGAASSAIKKVGVPTDGLTGFGTLADLVTEKASAAGPALPPVTAVIVIGHDGMTHLFPSGRWWDIDEAGVLAVEDDHERIIAEFAAGAWTIAKDVFGDA